MALVRAHTRSLAAFALLAALAASPVLCGQARAGGMPLASSTAASDPCSAPLPVDLAAAGGGPALRFADLHAGRLRFELIQFPDGLRGLLRQLHAQGQGPAPLPGDAAGRFTFVAGTRAYLGPVHVFRHGAVQHLCLSGPVAVEREQNGHEYGPRQVVRVRLDGTLVGRALRVTLTVGHAVYWLYGTATGR